MYKLREERLMKPETFAHLVSSMQYERRFGPYFAGPVIAGLDDAGTPFLCGMDSIGAMETAKDFMVQVGKAAGKVARSAQHMTSGQSLSHAC
jgi:20S proteasome subunit beta 3